MNLQVLGDMIHALGKAEEDAFNSKMQMLAWQTALLMNSTGNYKKKVKPTDLFNPEEKGTVEKADVSEEDKQNLKKQMQEELLKTFAGSI